MTGDGELSQETQELRKELLRRWEFNHAEHCRGKWPHDGPCFWPIPALVSSLSTEEVCSLLGQLEDRCVLFL